MQHALPMSTRQGVSNGRPADKDPLWMEFRRLSLAHHADPSFESERRLREAYQAWFVSFPPPAAAAAAQE